MTIRIRTKKSAGFLFKITIHGTIFDQNEIRNAIESFQYVHGHQHNITVAQVLCTMAGNNSYEISVVMTSPDYMHDLAVHLASTFHLKSVVLTEQHVVYETIGEI